MAQLKTIKRNAILKSFFIDTAHKIHTPNGTYGLPIIKNLMLQESKKILKYMSQKYLYKYYVT